VCAQDSEITESEPEIEQESEEQPIEPISVFVKKVVKITNCEISTIKLINYVDSELNTIEVLMNL
jgi:hypothetical protein